MTYQNFDLREKYRPQTFSEIVGNRRVVERLQKIIKSHQIPRGLLFCGPTGSGKTTLARIMVKALHCQNFNNDVCGECVECSSFENHFPGSNNYSFHDCSQLTRKELDEIIYSLRFGFPTSPTGLHIHLFDEYHRMGEPSQDKFLIPLEQYYGILLIFCLIDDSNITRAFRGRVQVLETKPPEIDELIPWLQGICAAEGITIKDSNALRQVAVSANQLPRDCLGLLQQAYFLGEPLSTSLVKELAQNQGSSRRDSEYPVK
jgi:DNA polymerase-3 subunit gamma/tau